MKYKIGDKVKIRSWNSMIQEFGVTNTGDIYIPLSRIFTKKMKKWCKKVVIIKKINSYPLDFYNIKENMHYWYDEMIDHDATRILNIINRLKKLKSNIENSLDIDLIDAQIKVLKSKKPYFTENNVKIYNKMFREIKTKKGNINEI